MGSFSPSQRQQSCPRASTVRGIALIIVLLILVLITVITIALLSIAGIERSTSSMALQHTQAELLADMAADKAMGTISDAISQGTQPNKSWASEPGRIWIFDIASGTGEITRKSIDLFSALPGADPDNVDLNTPSLNGEFPIAPPASGKTAANMKVGWMNFVGDPSMPAAKTNPIVGRIAYWVDDESCKININTADGSQRNATPADMAASKKYSFGFGTPSELSLAALPGLDNTKAAAIADSAWQQEFNSSEEITRVKDAGGNQVVTPAMFQALRFDITHYNSSPDLNFMGEPQLELLFSPIAASGTVPRQNTMLGPYQLTQAQTKDLTQAYSLGLTLDHIYPQPSQLPLPADLPTGKLFLHTFADPGQQLSDTSNDFYVGRVITNFLNGVNLKGQSFTWPKFEGADSSGFAGKYTPRQLDSIALQILDTVGKSTFCDQFRPYSMLGIMNNGWLSNQPVMGVGRAPKLTEILITASTALGDPFGYGSSYPSLMLNMTSEFYFPKGYKGIPMNGPYDGSTSQWGFYLGRVRLAAKKASGMMQPATINFYDFPALGANGPSAHSQFNTLWMDSMLTDTDQNGEPAGIDLLGTSSNWDDPDQANAALYHPYCLKNGKYCGSVLSTGSTGRTISIFEGLDLLGAGATDIAPGCYVAGRNRYYASAHPAKPGITSIRLKGGLLYSTHYEAGSSGYVNPILTPLDSMMPELLGVAITPAVIAQIKESLIPVDLTVAVPGFTELLLRTADPLVNQFPGDWQVVLNPTPADKTLNVTSASSAYLKGGIAALDPFYPPDSTVTNRATNLDGDNPGFRPSGGGDPLSIWLPTQDNRIPKQARFPSVGGLFSIRTGLFPDKSVASKPVKEQHGVPFRGLNMSPSTQASQTTEGGTSYPDWAMLDLFTVPFLPQKPYMTTDTFQPYRRLTYGGATVGRININNPVTPYPFSEATPGVTQTPPQRNALKALFQGLTPSKSYDSNNEPVYTTIDADGSATLAQAISDYQKTNGPFFMAGQLANVPAVAAYLYTGVAPSSVSRNDLLRDTIGAITTRSNVYSVWVVAQTIKKASLNANYGIFEDRDKITSEVRRHYVIERFIETGKDGVPGNAVASALADTPNAFPLSKPNGDNVDANYHPALTYPLPYRWRVISVEDIQQ